MFEFIRGDTFAFEFSIKSADGNPILKQDIETLFVTVRAHPDELWPAVIEKTLEDVTIDEEGVCHAIFEPADTSKLSCQKYSFDIEITLTSGYRKTMVSGFEVKPDVTIHQGGNDES